MVVFLLIFSCFSAATPIIPSDWKNRYDEASLFFTTSEFHTTPQLGNGALATHALSEIIHAAGVFNGAALDPPNRVEIPAFVTSVQNANVPNTSITAMDIGRAVFLKRYNVTGGAQIEERFYAHAVRTYALVHEIEITNPSSSPVTISFMGQFSNVSSGIAFQPLRFCAGLCVGLIGVTQVSETPQTPSVVVAVVSTPPLPPVTVPPASSISIRQISVVLSSLNSSDPANDAIAAFKDTSAVDDLFTPHAQAWELRWNTGRIEISDDFELAQAVNASLYALLASASDLLPYGLSPGGLGNNAYSGHTFWDQDTWMYPTLLLLHPTTARMCLQYRSDRISGASIKAISNGYQGLMFPWESACTGQEVQGSGGKVGPWGQFEQHISNDVALAFWQFWQASGDLSFLRDFAWPVLSGVADFWTTRVSLNGSTFSVYNVMPPDEYHFPCNDSVYTNVGVQQSITHALAAAQILGIQVPSNWTSVANNILIPFDADLVIHPEFEGYTGDQVKQADTILIGYPLQFSMPPSVRRNDLEYYAARTDPGGPAMTWSMFAVGWLEAGNFSMAEKMLNLSFIPHLIPPFNVWAEGLDGSGTPNFITGAGGFLQLMAFGYPGLRLTDKGLLLKPAVLPRNSSAMALHGVAFMSQRLRIEISKSTVTLQLLSNGKLTVTGAGGSSEILTSEAPLRFDTGTESEFPLTITA